jgi:hypothetical protein
MMDGRRGCLWKVIEPPRARHLREYRKRAVSNEASLTHSGLATWAKIISQAANTLFLKWRVYNAFIIPTLVIIVGYAERVIYKQLMDVYTLVRNVHTTLKIESPA